MDIKQTDVAVIGGGTAGLEARRAAMKAGARVLLINDGPWGTTCVRSGCMPSKLLLAAARAARDARAAAEFGVAAQGLKIDGRAVMARVQKQRDRFLEGILKQVSDIPAGDKLEARARFTGPTTLDVGGIRVEAKAVVIATGSRSAIPPKLKPVADRVLTNETVFDLPDLPASLAVIGAGPLGLELALAFARLGVRVTVFNQGRTIGGLKDSEVERVAHVLLAAEIELKLGVDVSAEDAKNGARLTWSVDGKKQDGAFDKVLAAAGRPPQLKDLDLAAAGLSLDEHGSPNIDPETLRCGDGAIFIAGDASHLLPVLHEASRQGRLAGTNAARFPKLKSEPAPASLSITFTDPDIARVGAAFDADDPDLMIGRCDFQAGRGIIEGDRRGVIRLYAGREDGVIRGAEMVGPSVEHLAHLVSSMVQQKVTVETALAWPFYHPTYEEDLKDCLTDLARQRGLDAD
jgi:dihydrolipoamide dehydrogenase